MATESEQESNFQDGTDIKTQTLDTENSDHFNSTVIVVSVVCSFAIVVVMATFFFVRFFCNKKKKSEQLDQITPQVSTNTYTSNTIGVRYAHPIQFTLPTLTVEESDTGLTNESDTDKDSHSSLNAGWSSGACVGLSSQGIQSKYNHMEYYSISADEIEPDLYISEHDEPANVQTTGLGKVGFSLQYNVIRQQLCVKVIGATSLPAKFLQKVNSGKQGTANPFVKLVLHPEKSPKYLTKVQRNTTNPIFQEMFVFPAKIDTINTRILSITVWDYDKFSRKMPIGGVSIPLQDMGINPSVKDDIITNDMWRDLSSKETEKQSRGELMFSLSFKPESSILTISIIKAKQLQWPDIKGEKEHVYVKIRIMEGKKLIKSRKTPTIRKRPIPEFDFTFSQCVPGASLNDVTVDLYVYIKSGFSGKQLIGRTQVGNTPDVMDQGVHHWTDMLDAPRSTVAQWHSIY